MSERAINDRVLLAAEVERSALLREQLRPLRKATDRQSSQSRAESIDGRIDDAQQLRAITRR